MDATLLIKGWGEAAHTNEDCSRLAREREKMHSLHEVQDYSAMKGEMKMEDERAKRQFELEIGWTRPNFEVGLQ